MKIKNNIFRIIIFLLIVSCSPKEKAYNKDKATEWIIGEWGIYSSFSGSSQIHCNSCPKIIFQKNQNAELIYPDQEKENYSWKIKSGQLILSFNSGIEGRRHFRKEKYQIEFEEKSTDKDLIILYRSKESGYKLGKN